MNNGDLRNPNRFWRCTSPRSHDSLFWETKQNSSFWRQHEEQDSMSNEHQKSDFSPVQKHQKFTNTSILSSSLNKKQRQKSDSSPACRPPLYLNTIRLYTVAHVTAHNNCVSTSSRSRTATKSYPEWIRKINAAPQQWRQSGGFHSRNVQIASLQCLFSWASLCQNNYSRESKPPLI